jgi:hypothetical protein
MRRLKLLVLCLLLPMHANAIVVFVGKVPVIIGSAHSKNRDAKKEEPKNEPKKPIPYYGCSDGLDQYSRPCVAEKK